MQISPNMMLTARYIGAGATLAAGGALVSDALDGDGKASLIKTIGTGAAIATGIGVTVGGHNTLGRLPFASGNHAILKSIGMVAAAAGAAYVVGTGLND